MDNMTRTQALAGLIIILYLIGAFTLAFILAL